MKNSKSNHAGFTIIETLIATMVFSVILIIITFAIVRIGQAYYKGVTETNTQDTAHSILTSISQAIQYNGGPVNAAVNGDGTYVICAGDSRYTALMGKVLVDSSPVAAKNETNYALMFDTNITNCSPSVHQSMTPPPVPPASSQELLGPMMRVAALSVCTPGMAPAGPDCNSPPALGSNLYQIHLRVVYGGDAVLNAGHDDCLGGSVNQFCAISDLSTTVEKRIN